MNEQEVANSILQDILNLPIAKYLANLLLVNQQYVQNKPDIKKIFDWLLTGQYSSGTLSSNFIDYYAGDPEGTVYELIDLIRDNSKDQSPLYGVLSDFVIDNFTAEEIQELVKKLKFQLALINVLTTSGKSFDIDLNQGLDEAILYGKTDHWIDDELFELYFTDAKKLKEKIIKQSNQCSDLECVVGNLMDMFDEIEHNEDEEPDPLWDVIRGNNESIFNKYTSDQFLEYMLGVLPNTKVSNEINVEDINTIYNYFHPAPVAPEAPNAFKTYK